MTKRQEFMEKISRGIAVLDKKIPEWYQKIDIESLRMNSINYCIIGQLYDGQYTFGCAELFDTTMTAIIIEPEICKEHGFDSDDTSSRDYYINNCDLLTELWKQVILAKLS